MEEISFQMLSAQFPNLMNNINDSVILNLYSNFEFLYLYSPLISNNTELTKDLIHDLLEEYKFITYHYDSTLHHLINLKNMCHNNSTEKKNVVICAEKTCFIILQIDPKVIEEVLVETNSSKNKIINTKSNSETEEKLVHTEINEFVKCKYKQFKDNQFVKSTINSIICYMIRRFFCPSNFFEDESFFKFNSNENDHQIDDCIHKMLVDIFEPCIDENRMKNIIQKFQIDSSNLLKNQKHSKPIICEFHEEDFIFLRHIHHSNDGSDIYLVLHCESFHIFALKALNFSCPIHEIDFIQNHSHHCLTKFYGFLKKENQIKGIVYEFMTNGSLEQYINSKKDQINDVFSFMTMARIFEGIQYLHSNRYIHRDLKPSNILLNNDFIPFISDFETVKHLIDNAEDKTSTFDFASPIYAAPEQICGGQISYPTDIYSFGCIIYFLFYKKHINLKINEESMTNNVPQNIINLYSACIKFDQNDRIKLDQIENEIINEIKSYSYIEKYLIKEPISIYYEIIPYINENISILMKNQLILNSYLSEILTIDLINILYTLKYKENTNRLLLMGDFYYYGFGSKKDYSKAIKYYELAAIENNSEGYYKLGEIYFFSSDYSTAIYYYEKAAEQNHLGALEELGNIYYIGYHSKPNYSKAISYYEKIVDKNSDCAFNLGFIYFNGKVDVQDYVKAKKYFELAAKNNDSFACFYLGLMYYSGRGVKQDYLIAKKYFENSAKQGNPEAFFYLGQLYYFGNGVELNYLKAKDYFELAGKKDHSDALNYLGSLYYYEYGVKQDYSVAKYYFELSANQNNHEALLILGKLYYNGYGVKPNYKISEEYIKKAADQNNSEAIILIALFYLNGVNKQDYQKAKNYFEKAADMNIPEAFYFLGDMYLNGHGVKKDYLKAREYYERAATYNQSDAIYNLGEIYYHGHGVKKDLSLSIELFNKAAKLGNTTALCMLGNIYFNGIGVEKDYNIAVKYIELAANANDCYAFHNLGILYLNGYGVECNYTKALNYFLMAAEKGCIISYLSLCTIYLLGKGVQQDLKTAHKYFNLFVEKNQKNNIDLSHYIYDGLLHTSKTYLLSIYKNFLEISQQLGKEHSLIDIIKKISNLFCSFNFTHFSSFREDEKNDENSLEFILPIKDFLSKLNAGIITVDLKQYMTIFSSILDISSHYNDSNSLYVLGLKHYYGLDTQRDYLKAKEYFTEASKQNNSYGSLCLGFYFIDGFSGPCDYSQAIKYFKKSAEMNNSVAMNILGNLYQKGLGVEKNHLEAKRYFELSAKQNDSDGLFYLGYLYLNGIGVSKNIKLAIQYFERSAIENNSKALVKLGNIYSKGVIVQRNFNTAKKYYEIATIQNNPDSFFHLGDLYSNGEFFDIDIQSAVINFQKCIELNSETVLRYNPKDDSFWPEYRVNKYRYRAYNDLGLIYITYLEDINESIKYIKEAAFSEYPFGQNNLGLLYQFYLKKKDDAEYMYKRASKHQFALAEFNLGHLYEENGKKKESIENYVNASNDEDQRLIFQGHHHYDKRLEISKTFILCYTNLKLTEHFFLESDFDESKKYFVRSFKKLITNTNDFCHQFRFIFNRKYKTKDIFEYLKFFIFNYPPFNQQNLNLDLNLVFNIDFNSYQKMRGNKPKKTKTNNSNTETSIFNKLFNINEKNNNCYFELFKKSHSIFNEKENNYFESEKILNEFLKSQAKLEKQDDQILPKDDIIIETPEELFDFVIQNKELKIIFIESIRDIINIMNKILYTPPYNILFGRIFIAKFNPKLKNSNKNFKNKNIKDINHLFYEGFGLL